MSKERHDGWLGNGSRAFHSENCRGQGIRIEGEYCTGPEETVFLTPQNALSLRDWLVQESPALEKLAKEQAQ